MSDATQPETSIPEPVGRGLAPIGPRAGDAGASHHFMPGPYQAGTQFNGPLPHADEQAAGRRGFSPRDLLVQAFYNARLIRNVAVAGAVMGVLGLLTARTHYTADALLLLVSNPDASMSSDFSGQQGGGAGALDGTKMVQSEVQLIQSDDVLRRAVEQVGPAELFPSVGGRRLGGLLPPAGFVEQEAAAVKRFHNDLRVDNDPGTNVIRVSFTSADRDISIAAVQALVTAYTDRRRDVYSGNSGETIAQQINRYAEQLRTIESQVQTTRNHYGVLDITQDVALAANRLDGLTQRENQVRERRTTVHAEMLAAQDRLARTPQQVFDSKEQTNNANNDDSRNTLLRLEQDREHMAAQYSPTWPQLQEIDRKIAAARSSMSEGGKTNFYTSRSIRNPVVDQMSQRLASLQVEDQALDKQLAEIGDQARQAEQHVADLRQAESKLHDLKRSQDVAEQIYRQLQMRQAGAEVRDAVVDRGAASLRVVQPATSPLTGHSMGLTYLAAGIILGLAMAVAASVIATLMRQVYIMPTEAERDLDLPSLAEFSVAASDMTSRQARQEVGNLAAFMLDVTIDGRPMSVVQVASAGDEDGKADLVRALATELAQGHGLRTLILDLHSDGREEARALGAPGGDRHLSVIENDMPVVATDVPQLWVSVDAAKSALGNARTLVTRSREMLDGLRQHFDMVLIIAPADVSDYSARRLSALVDANLLVIRSEHTRAPVAGQLRDVILSAGGNLLGFAYTWRKYHIPAAIYKWL